MSDYGFPQDEDRMPGGILSLSWDGERGDSAVVWASHPTHDDAMNKTVAGTLRAYDALDLNNELWTSDWDAEGNDRVGRLAKFCPPVVANGRVYVNTFSRELAVYGLFEDIGKPVRSDDIGIFELRNIGAAQKSGSCNCGKYDLRMTGTGIGGAKDEFLLAFIERDAGVGAIEISACINGINAPNYPDAVAGVMIRRSFDQNERFAAVVITDENTAMFLHRDGVELPVEQDGPVDVTLPVFVRLKAQSVAGKAGRVDFIGEISKDGSSWRVISAVTEIRMDDVADVDLKVGLAVTAQPVRALIPPPLKPMQFSLASKWRERNLEPLHDCHPV